VYGPATPIAFPELQIYSSLLRALSQLIVTAQSTNTQNQTLYTDKKNTIQQNKKYTKT
jgi:hypothetical protein